MIKFILCAVLITAIPLLIYGNYLGFILMAMLFLVSTRFVFLYWEDIDLRYALFGRARDGD